MYIFYRSPKDFASASLKVWSHFAGIYILKTNILIFYVAKLIIILIFYIAELAYYNFYYKVIRLYYYSYLFCHPQL